MENAELISVDKGFLLADPVIIELERLVSPDEKSLSRQ